MKGASIDKRFVNIVEPWGVELQASSRITPTSLVLLDEGRYLHPYTPFFSFPFLCLCSVFTLYCHVVN